MAEEKLDTQVRREQIAEAALSLVADQGLRRLSVKASAITSPPLVWHTLVKPASGAQGEAANAQGEAAGARADGANR